MAATLDKTVIGISAEVLERHVETADVCVRTPCFHCGEPCPEPLLRQADKAFCCHGCRVVHDLLAESGLDHFYELNRHPGIRIASTSRQGQWDYLDDPNLQRQLLDFTDGKLSRITLHVPAIHCIACVWLLENLFRLNHGVGRSQVNFPRREVSILFAPQKIKLSELVSLLASIGYEPHLTLSELDKPAADRSWKRQWLQVGVAGFAFGNIMLFSLPAYLGFDTQSEAVFRPLFGYLSLALALPALAYSASDYWRSALLSFRQRVLTLDVPIAVGMLAIYAQSVFEIITRTGEGYLDSLTGLIFFLLCGRVFQQKTHERIAFDRDYKCFFPLSVTRLGETGEETVAISNLRVGDGLRLRNGELIPADAKLVSGEAHIDYSFVSGESAPVDKDLGDYLYAGGKQLGSAIEVETLKPVSQSYLTSLWNEEVFKTPKDRDHSLNTLTNRYSRRFTVIVVAIAIAAGFLWAAFGQPARGLKAFNSILIVACPCALALAAPFTLGTAQRILARRQVFVKNSFVLERMAGLESVVFDKTGTLTSPDAASVEFHPVAGTQLSSQDLDQARSLASQSTHPYATHIARTGRNAPQLQVTAFQEVAGAGIRGRVAGRSLVLGSESWLKQSGVATNSLRGPAGSHVYLAIDGEFRGAFNIYSALRPEIDRLLLSLSQSHQITLLSGDNERDRHRFSSLFDQTSQLRFNQSPIDKLAFIRNLQQTGQKVMMVGDGLNDAGALKQSDVGVAVVERVGLFSPASDVILPAGSVHILDRILSLSRAAAKTVRLSFGISAAYNALGIGIAAAGILSPVICAILMPLSSVSVALFACSSMSRAGKRLGLGK